MLVTTGKQEGLVVVGGLLPMPSPYAIRCAVKLELGKSKELELLGFVLAYLVV